MKGKLLCMSVSVECKFLSNEAKLVLYFKLIRANMLKGVKMVIVTFFRRKNWALLEDNLYKLKFRA